MQMVAIMVIYQSVNIIVTVLVSNSFYTRPYWVQPLPTSWTSSPIAFLFSLCSQHIHVCFRSLSCWSLSNQSLSVSPESNDTAPLPPTPSPMWVTGFSYLYFLLDGFYNKLIKRLTFCLLLYLWLERMLFPDFSKSGLHLLSAFLTWHHPSFHSNSLAPQSFHSQKSGT